MRTYEIEDDGECWQFYLWENDKQVGGGTMEKELEGGAYATLVMLGECFVKAGLRYQAS